MGQQQATEEKSQFQLPDLCEPTFAGSTAHGVPLVTHCDTAWWNHPDTTAPFDDVKEAILQDKLLRTVFPDLFFDFQDSQGSQEARNLHLGGGPIFTNTLFGLGLMEGFQCPMLIEPFSEKSGGVHIRDALLRAIDTKDKIDQNLEEAGL